MSDILRKYRLLSLNKWLEIIRRLNSNDSKWTSGTDIKSSFSQDGGVDYGVDS
jgi:hypothetical protein